MSANVKSDPHTLRILIAIGLIAFGWSPLPLAAAATCDSAIPLAAGDTWRDPGGAPGEAALFSVRPDAPGTLALEASAPSGGPRVTLALVRPEEAGTPASTILHESATCLVLDGVSPGGTYLVRVAAEDPRRPLAPFRLSVLFAADRRVGGLSKSETDGELEIEPDPLVAEAPAGRGLGGVIARLAPRLCELCAGGESDDHGDGFLCATALSWNRSVSGEIGNDWGDDGDVFRFRLAALVTVEIRAGGDSELVSELYDGHGQRLDVAGGTDPRLVRTLVPGTYFVRVEGRDGAGGRYTLSVGPASLER